MLFQQNLHDPDHIQWHTFLADNWSKQQEWKIIAKYNHDWLPLQTSHHMHSTSEQQYCPSCLGHPNMPKHFLQCAQPAWQQHWVEYHELLLKYLLCNPIPHDLQELLLMGLHHSHHSETLLPPHLGQNPQLTPIIEQQQALGWQQMLHGRFTSVWHDYLCQHAPQINSYQFFAKITQLGWQTILKSWNTRNSHLHPPIIMQTSWTNYKLLLKEFFMKPHAIPYYTHSSPIQLWKTSCNIPPDTSDNG